MSTFETFLEDLKQAVINAKKLTITTAVGPIVWDDKTSKYKPVAGPVRAMQTELDLLEGDKVTLMDQDFATGDLQALRDYHLKEQADSRALIKHNIEAIRALLNLFLDVKQVATAGTQPQLASPAAEPHT